MSGSGEVLVWLDMEMTGLDPEVDVPIEVAMVITSSELEERDHAEMVIWQPDSQLERMLPIVREMHTANGLLEKVRKASTSVADAERMMLSLLKKYTEPKEGVLCGNSIHQDRRFLAKYFPVINGYLHYRMVDVSTVKELARRWYGSEVLYPKLESDHTALTDTRASIAELKHFRAKIMRPRGGV